eukprot:g21184.t1
MAAPALSWPGNPESPRVDSLSEELRGFSRSTTHLLYLGIYLSPAEESWLDNWQALEKKVSAGWGRWTGPLRVLSYRRRVLVINQLVASMLWDRLDLIRVWDMIDLYRTHPPVRSNGYCQRTF